MRRPVIVVATVVVLVLLPVVAHAGGGGGGGACRGFGSGPTLVMRDSCFEGTGHRVEAGTTLTVVNEGLAPHTVTAVDGSFDSGSIAPGERWELVLAEPGVVPIYCTLHGTADGHGMAGLLVVGGPPTTAAASSSEGDAGSTAWPWLVLAASLGAVGGGVVAHRRHPADAPAPTSAAQR